MDEFVYGRNYRIISDTILNYTARGDITFDHERIENLMKSYSILGDICIQTDSPEKQVSEMTDYEIDMNIKSIQRYMKHEKNYNANLRMDRQLKMLFAERSKRRKAQARANARCSHSLDEFLNGFSIH